MSWNIQVVGVPEKIAAELDVYEETLTGTSREEFQEAKPHLQALVLGNVGQSLVKLNASGHASFIVVDAPVPGGSSAQRKKTNGNVSVAIDPFYGKVTI